MYVDAAQRQLGHNYDDFFIGDFTLTPQYFASSLSVNCHDSQFHRLPTMKFASSLSVNCHDSQFHRLPTISSTYGR